MIAGYARVSTEDQDLGIQEAALRAAGCDVIRAEKRSGTSREGRVELSTLMQFLRTGDALVVTRVDRLARSIGDLQDIVRQLRARGVTLRATEQPIDTGTAAGKAFLDMLGVFAEFETNLRRERQAEGIARAKAAGVYRGRKPKVQADRVAGLKAVDGLGASAIAASLGISRASVYRALRRSPRPAPLAEAGEMSDGKAGQAISHGEEAASVSEPAETAASLPADPRGSFPVA